MAMAPLRESTKMADDPSNDDQWLYGDSIADTVCKDESAEQSTTNVGNESTTLSDEPPSHDATDAPPGIDAEEAEPQQTEAAEQDGEADDKNEGEVDDDDDDSDDDDVNVVIGDIKTSPAYSSLNIKRGGLLTSATIDKIGGKQPGKFSIEEFEQIGTINGLPAHEFNLDSLEDKPWRKPGADITDYFNYGFNEETWRAYCERQKRMRVHESGVGLGPLANTLGGSGTGQPGSARPGSIPVAIVNDNSKYAAALGMRKAGPPPGRKVAGSIDVIGSGGGTLASRRNNERDTPPKENVIQVMTADRREYSRKSSFPDMSVPPPAPTIPPATFDIPPPIPVVPSTFPPPVPPPANYGPQEFYSPDTDPYYQSYEPTQEQQQWSSHEPFVPREEGLPGIPSVSSVKVKEEAKSSPKASSSSRDVRERDRERDREKHRSVSRTHPGYSHRRRSHRHRSRSRSPSERDRKSRRHKSRSRSPGHRSHRKKKSKKSDKSKDDDSD